MDPRTENSNTNQKQEQPSSSSNSSVPPLSNVASITQQQHGHGFEYNNIIVISDVTDDDDQRKEMIENQNPLLGYIVSNESGTESDDDDDDDDRNKQFYDGVAKRYASFIPIQQIDDDYDSSEDDGVLREIDDGSPTPFSETIKAIQERIAKTKKMGFVDESLIWVPKRNGEDLVNRRFCVPSLEELSFKALANHVDGLVSLDGIPDEFKQRLCALLCDSGKMNARFLEVLLSGSPTHVWLKDCSWLT
ncbi:hypothetical protein MtrunA17_Chr3g0092211 [Medicago truncatula]|uniref:Rad7, putative n=1 Tax=Medicago truncatula TaxID=3880 RepID=A0A072UU11_MEDTR|nr:Rad7, putative [Medicago truncatula]RHN66540.1 hypothetical protein MtrunA17_Chr3g0092211 [Medicago truncatula]